MARQHGSKGQMWIDPAGATAYAQVASINNWTLDMARDLVDVTCFGDTNKQYVQGLPDVKGTFGGQWDPTTTPTQIFDVAMGDLAVGLKLVPSSLTTTAFFSGLAYLDSSIDVPHDGSVTIAGKWAAAGPWTLAP